MKKDKKILLITFGLIILIGGMFVLGRRPGASPGIGGSPGGALADLSANLTSPEARFDFGTISMARGPVSHRFQLVNVSKTEPIALAALYTSCMCTTAKLVTQKSTEGPFGMRGHGFLPKLSVNIMPEEKAVVEVTFDPAAHGPAGIGRIERTVFLEEKDGGSLTFNFTATVTP